MTGLKYVGPLAAVAILAGGYTYHSAAKTVAPVPIGDSSQPSLATGGTRMGCTKGRWRLAKPSSLRTSLLSISHVLVRHSESLPRNVPLSILDWMADLPPATRSRDEAVRIATELRARLAKSPHSFSAVAITDSEDPITKVAGGRLGILPASEFLVWPAIIDCLAALEDGQISELVETDFGIHIFRRDPTPAAELFSAKRLVVGYRDAGFLNFVRRPGFGAGTSRSKGEALSLALDLARRAKYEDFDLLVQQYSEHRDAARAGDIGLWSSREPTIFPRLLDTILSTQVGSVSNPIDSELGYQVFLRTKPVERPRFAMRARRFAFDPGQSGAAPGSPETTLRIAENTLAAWRSALTQSSDSQEFRDKGNVESWSLGRGPDGAEQAMLSLPIGELAPRPIVSDYTYLIAMRVEPTSETERVDAQIGLPAL